MSFDRSRLVVAMAIVSIPTGCAFRPQTTHMAVEYNDFVAEATNRQTVLNILRARNREPMHFTSISQVHGSATIEGNAALSSTVSGTSTQRAPVTPGDSKLAVSQRSLAATTFTPNFSVKVDTGTDFDIAINATDDFWKGIMTPVSSDMMVYFIREGWPKDMLSYLFIERMDYSATVTDDKGHKFSYGHIGSVVDDLDDQKSADAFRSAMQCRTLAIVPDDKEQKRLDLGSGVTELRGVSKDALGMVHVPDDPDKDKDPVPGPDGKGTLVKDPVKPKNTYVELTAEASSFKLALSKPNEPSGCTGDDVNIATWLKKALPDGWVLAPANIAKAMQAAAASGGGEVSETSQTAGGGAFGSGRGSSVFEAKDYCTRFLDPAKTKNFKCDLSINLSTRSTEGIIYFLGEYARHETAVGIPDGAPGIGQAYDVPIFAISETPYAPQASFVDVEFKGHRYYVPSSGRAVAAPAGRSSEVITLVQQLLNLYRTSKDFPATPYVRIEN